MLTSSVLDQWPAAELILFASVHETKIVQSNLRLNTSGAVNVRFWRDAALFALW